MSASAAWDLAFGIIAVLVIFALASRTRRTIPIGVLLVLIPFQFVDTKYGSSSVLMAYALGALLIISGDFKLRMLPALALIIFAYLASFAMADRELLVLHAIEIFQFFSCLLVFLIAYNFARLIDNERTVIDVLVVMNALVVVYCALQLTAGPGERFVPLGIDSLAFNVNRHPGDPRLVGPFGNPGSTAGYFTLMTLVCAVDLMYSVGKRRLLVQLLTGVNLIGLVATANRAGFMVLLAMFPALLFTFRRRLGARRILTYAIGGATAIAVAGTLAVVYTDFDRMFSRMRKVTETTESGLPTTRQSGWPVAVEKVKENPWFGEGPHFWTSEDAERTGQLRAEFEELGDLSTAYDHYPHSLYLFLLRTVGVIGLIAVVGFFMRTWWILRFSDQMDLAAGEVRAAIVRLGLLLIPAFLVTQVTLEFIRPETIDYAQFIFALMGLLVGTSDRTLLATHVPSTSSIRPIEDVASTSRNEAAVR